MGSVAETEGGSSNDEEEVRSGEGEDTNVSAAPDKVHYIHPFTHPALALRVLAPTHAMQNHTRLMFKSYFTHSLLMGTKVMTSRIGWCEKTVAKHTGCMERGELVRACLGYGYDSTLGWLLYKNIWTQRVGDITVEQVVLEGKEDMPIRDFQNRYLGLYKERKDKSTVTLTTLMTCVQFVLYPMIGPIRGGK